MQLSTPRTIIATAFAAAAFALTGCVADPETADPLPDGGTGPTHVSEVSFPDSEVAETSEWVVDQINGTRAINKQDWYPRVSPEMSEEIPVDSIVGTLNSDLRPSMPYVPSEYSEPEEHYGITRLTPDLTAASIDLHVRVDDSGLITDLWYDEVANEDASEQPDSTDDEDSAPSGGGLGQ